MTMKSDIHPNYHMIKVVMTNGVEFMTRSTYGEEGATLNLDIDPNTHPAWTGGSQQLLDRGGRLSRFNTRFGGIGIGGKKSRAWRPLSPRSLRAPALQLARRPRSSSAVTICERL
jgi:large subunit ribosomal protein L31